MKTEAPAPIPIPLEQRWRDARMRVLPVLIFTAALVCTGLLWKDNVASPIMVGQAEPVLSNASCHKAGVLAELKVTRFQRVKKDDEIGTVMVTDPKILAASLAVIQSEIESLRVNLKPIADVRRGAMGYDRLRLEWMQQRAQLASSRANLQLAESDFERMTELFKDKIIAQRDYDKAKALRDKYQNEVEEWSKSVNECERSLADLQVTNANPITKVTADPLVAAIAVQESKLKLTEAEMAPVVIKAPMDGIVTLIYHRAGEAITAGQPIVAIATLDPVRIVGYLRPPILEEPKVGMKVTIRTRSIHRETGVAKIIEVGTQLEQIPATLLGPVNLASIVQGLPVDVSLPPNLKIRAGELVDITLAKAE